MKLTANLLHDDASMMKVTSRGQITIPIALRERFGLNPGTEVDFVAIEGVMMMKPGKRSSKSTSASKRWLAKAAGSAKPGMSTDEIMALTRGENWSTGPISPRRI